MVLNAQDGSVNYFLVQTRQMPVLSPDFDISETQFLIHEHLGFRTLTNGWATANGLFVQMKFLKHESQQFSWMKKSVVEGATQQHVIFLGPIPSFLIVVKLVS